MMIVQVSQPPPIPDPERNKEEPRQEKTQVEFLFIILLWCNINSFQQNSPFYLKIYIQNIVI